MENNILSDNEKELYKRQLMLYGFTERHQEMLKASTALIAGVGGLGGTAAMYLAVAGIGRLILVHYGTLTLSNMNRQILMKHNLIGLERIQQAKDTINAVAPYVEIETVNVRLNDQNVEQLLSMGVHIALSARPNFYERRVLNRACVRQRIPMVEAAMCGMEGYIFNVIGGITPCLECVFPQDDPQWEELGFPVLGAVSGVLGCLMSIEAIKIITNYAPPLMSKKLIFNTATLDFQKLKIFKDGNCPVCSSI
ncbi:MAG: HesA/MoeB/ThiF family protein [Candidatus Magnetoovum sp. WYHC-5]|nr:HesA/MoeB/ThiF family protein [Candidatus Magnetoovum sp. WYHC-5]